MSNKEKKKKQKQIKLKTNIKLRNKYQTEKHYKVGQNGILKTPGNI